GQRLSQGLNRDAKPRMNRMARGNELILDLDRGIDRDREGQTLIGAVLRIDLRIDADDLPGRIEKRPAGIAGVDRGVGLDEADTLARERTPGRADDTGGGAFFESEGLPD